MQMKLLVLVCGVWHEESHVSSWHLVFGLQTSRSGSVEGTRLRVWGFGPGVPVLFWVCSRVQVSESKVWVQDPEFGSGDWCLSTDDHCVQCNANMSPQVNGVEAG